MKHLLLTLTIAFLCNSINAQITGPDTVYATFPAQFSTPHKAITYTWTHDDVDILPVPGTQSVVTDNILLGQMTYVTMNNDNGHYYSFATNYQQNTINKIDYGNSPLNTPTVTSMGTFGLNSGATDGLEVIKDASGNWYAIVVGWSQMLRLSFGTSLGNNSPTATLWSFPANMAWAHQLMLKQDGNNWIAFVANRSGVITRFDFGTSLNNTPTPTNLPVVGGYTAASNLSLYKQSGNWYMLVTNLTDNSATRLLFGTNLTNNNPTGDYLGNINLSFALPRGISTLVDCDQQLISYIMNEQGALAKLEHQANFAGTPTASIIGTYPSGSIYNSITPFTYDGTLYYLATHTSSTLYRFKAFDYPAQTSTNYYTANYTHTYSTPGTYDLVLHCDQGLPQGPAAYCKQIVVLDSALKVSSVNKGVAITVYPNPGNGIFMLKGSIQSQYNTAQAQVVDMVGRTVSSQAITIRNNAVEQEISIPASCPAGSYFLKVMTPEHNEVLQVSKL
jgi:hypothetical protein